jgi:hypothetical protein
MVVAQHQTRGTDVQEGLQRFDATRGIAQDKQVMVAGSAPYLTVSATPGAPSLQGATNGTIGPQNGVAPYVNGQ